jgi:hypothetical protein
MVEGMTPQTEQKLCRGRRWSRERMQAGALVLLDSPCLIGFPSALFSIESMFEFHPELFEQRTLALETLAQHDYIWLEHFSSIDLLHAEFGLEVCGIPEKQDAQIILSILEELFPDWSHKDLYYYKFERDRGWKAIIFKNKKRGRKVTA